MRQYLNLLADTMSGEFKEDRTGTGTYSLFGRQMHFDLREGFPLLTTKKLHTKSIFHELLWFIAGDTNVKYLKDNGVRIWNEWADEQGNLGPIYGKQWRDWYAFKGAYKINNPDGTSHESEPYHIDSEHIDQLQNAIDLIIHDPHSRRIIVNAWNVGDIRKMALPPCHMFFQFNVSGDRKYLDLQMYQRSADIFLGVPFNIASYALLLCMIGRVTNKIPRKLVWTGGDVHLYSNHIDAAQKQLLRKPTELPSIHLPFRRDIDDYVYEDITIKNYIAQDHIPAPIAV